MAHPNGTQQAIFTLSVDKQKRPLIHVLMSDGRVTEFRTTTIVVPEGPRDDDDARVFGLLMNGRGEVFVDANGDPVVMEAPPLVMGRTEPHPDDPLTWEDVAEHAGVSLRTVRRAVEDGKLAPPQPVSKRAVRFRLGDVQTWLDEMKRPERQPLEDWLRERARKS